MKTPLSSKSRLALVFSLAAVSSLVIAELSDFADDFSSGTFDETRFQVSDNLNTEQLP